MPVRVSSWTAFILPTHLACPAPATLTPDPSIESSTSPQNKGKADDRKTVKRLDIMHKFEKYYHKHPELRANAPHASAKPRSPAEWADALFEGTYTRLVASVLIFTTMCRSPEAETAGP